MGKCIVVEGRADKLRLEPLLAEPVTILCTNGTISEDGLIDLLEPYMHHDIVAMFDVDRNGEKLRNLAKRTFSEINHLIIPQQYIEVEKAPKAVLRELLKEAKFIVHEG